MVAEQPKQTITHTADNDRIVVRYKQREQMREVRCGKGHLLCKATVGSIVECKCDKCKKTETYKVAA